ncbi:hypothetical protein BDZ90DRAFT_186587 [Jaminaea rosea]|uniref:Uncharacterized protein n=1 Tax=Jaminaea rosea TaxID=1569628 RepID=A0A316UT98_9BASI|nr:hypothetical protein BDZ90DRAFT_186587 [Jaminaea rosea]PWN27123.1 hypothetical protein BDZ90DRAFT_186587 [Jaminaea rosea]
MRRTAWRRRRRFVAVRRMPHGRSHRRGRATSTRLPRSRPSASEPVSECADWRSEQAGEKKTQRGTRQANLSRLLSSSHNFMSIITP